MLKTDVAVLKSDVASLRTDVRDLKQQVGGVAEGVVSLGTKIDAARIEAKTDLLAAVQTQTKTIVLALIGTLVSLTALTWRSRCWVLDPEGPVARARRSVSRPCCPPANDGEAACGVW